ncbi:hypothetical protein OIU78_006338 [Salix suchowensis]|nr:hypothetical protein OIU78_006338 [Salix suchowensis]
MENRALNLLDEALGLGYQTDPWPLRGKVVLIEDCVETSVIFLAFSHPLSHYDRILRKLGCNLVAQRENGRFFFFDMHKLLCPDEKEERNGKGGFISLYWKIQNTIRALPENNKNHATIMIDDMSLMEVAAHGSSDHVLDFMHYCHSLTSELAEPLATGLAADVHGQLTVLNWGFCNVKGSSNNKISNFHFKVKENSVEYFYPGTRT